MSLLALAQSGSVTPAHVNFSNSGRKKGLAGDALSGSGSTIGQLPVGAGQNLLSGALQSLQQAVNAQASVASASTGTAGATATSGVTGTAGSASATSGTSAAAGAAAVEAIRRQARLVRQTEIPS